MTDREKFINEFDEFLNSDDEKALVTGLDDDEKIRAILNELNNYFQRGTIYVSSLQNISDILNDAFGYENKVFPSKITRTKTYPFREMKLSFEKYSVNNNSLDLSINDDFAIFYPVQNALRIDKLFKQLSHHIEASKAEKTIIVATNDLFTDTEKIEKYVDIHIHYNCKNDNPELYNNTKNNIPGIIADIRGEELNPIYNELL